MGFIKTIVQNFVYFGAINYIVKDWFGLDLPKEVSIVFVVGWLTSSVLLGFLDEKIGFWKQEAIYGTETINPSMKKLIDQMDEVHKHLTKG